MKSKLIQPMLNAMEDKMRVEDKTGE